MKKQLLCVSIVTASLAVGSFASAAPKSGAKQYRFESYDLPADVGTETNINGSNNPGTVVGSFLSADGNRDGFIAGKRSFSEVTVAEADASNRGTVVAIAENGRAVGNFADAEGHTHIFVWSKQGGVTIKADPEGAVSTFAGDMNNPGTIVGWFEDGSGVEHGFILSREVYEVIDVPESAGTRLTGINDNGQVVGYSTDAEGNSQGFLLRDDLTTPILYPEATSTLPLGINDRGQIVGTYLGADGNNHGFLYDRGGYTTLDYPGALDTILTGISDSAEIVGTYDAVHGLKASTKGGGKR